MTSSQLDHLTKLKAHLEGLLANAKKRSPGEWKAESSRAYCADESVTHNVVGPPSDFMYLQELPDAIYIASCAGNAEAGWRSTLAAICAIKLIVPQSCPQSLLRENDDVQNAYSLMEDILAEWPLETLKA